MRHRHSIDGHKQQQPQYINNRHQSDHSQKEKLVGTARECVRFAKAIIEIVLNGADECGISKIVGWPNAHLLSQHTAQRMGDDAAVHGSASQR